jgi:hypothetical protein
MDIFFRSSSPIWIQSFMNYSSSVISYCLSNLFSSSCARNAFCNSSYRRFYCILRRSSSKASRLFFASSYCLTLSSTCLSYTSCLRMTLSPILFIACSIFCSLSCHSSYLLRSSSSAYFSSSFNMRLSCSLSFYLYRSFYYFIFSLSLMTF